MREIHVSDDTGSIMVVLWRDLASHDFKVEDVITLTNMSIKSWEKILRAHSSHATEINVFILF